MIIYVTSTTRPWNDIKAYAEGYFQERIAHSTLVLERPHMTPNEQLEWGDELFTMNKRLPREHNIVVASTLEIPILRILRRIREEWKNLVVVEVSTLVVQCLTSPKQMRDVHSLRVRSDGEFIDQWPEGFFEHRDEELF